MYYNGISIYNDLSEYSTFVMNNVIIRQIWNLYNSDLLPTAEPLQGFYPVKNNSNSKYIGFFYGKPESKMWIKRVDSTKDWLTLLGNYEFKWELKDSSRKLISIVYIYNHTRNEIYLPHELGDNYIKFYAYTHKQEYFNNPNYVSEFNNDLGYNDPTLVQEYSEYTDQMILDNDDITIIYLDRPKVNFVSVNTHILGNYDDYTINRNYMLGFNYIKIRKDSNGNFISAYNIEFKIDKIIEYNLIGDEWVSYQVNGGTYTEIFNLKDLIDNEYDISYIDNAHIVGRDDVPVSEILEIHERPIQLIDNYTLRIKLVDEVNWWIDLKTDTIIKNTLLHGDIVTCIIKYAQP